MLYLIPLGTTIFFVIAFIAINSSQDRSGSGMILFFLTPIVIFLGVIIWAIYFALGMFLGIR